MNSTYRIIISQTAKNDAKNIIYKVLKQRRNKAAGRQFYEQFCYVIRALAESPCEHPSITFQVANTKLWMRPINNYKIFYKVDREKQLIYILHILHDTFDWEYYL